MISIKGESKTIESNPNQNITYEFSTLPPSSKKFKFKRKKRPKLKYYYSKNTIPIKTSYPNLAIKLIGTIFIFVGILIFVGIIPGRLNHSITFAFIGVFIAFLIPLKKSLLSNDDILVILSLIIWTTIAYFITYQTDKEILFILILVGFIIIIEFSQEYISEILQKKLHILLSIIFVVFFLIIAEKIVIILQS